MKTFLFFFLLLATVGGLWAQEAVINGKVVDESGKPVQVNIRINQKYPHQTTPQGTFRETLKANEELQKVEAESKKYVVGSIKYDKVTGLLEVTVLRADMVLRGEVRNHQKNLLRKAQVFISDQNFQKSTFTDTEGKFMVQLPAGYKPRSSNSLRIMVDNLELEKGQITFKDDNYAALQKPEAKPNEPIVEKTPELTNSTAPQTDTKKTVTDELKVSPNKSSDPNYVADIHKITEDLELEKQLLEESSQKIQAQIQTITQKLENTKNLNPQTQAELRTELNALENKLAENNKAYQEAQAKTQEVINRMKNLLTEIDSLHEATQERLQVVESEKEKQEQEYRRNILIGSAIILFLLGLIVIFYFLYKKIKNQNDKITEQAELLRKVNDQIRVQNQALEMQKNIIEKKNQDITASLHYAQRIQNAMLPQLSVFQAVVPESFVFFQPREIVSGDFYWAYEHQTATEHKLIVSVVDCTGHGVPGAFMSLVGDALLNQIVKIQEIIEPEQILEHLNLGVQHTLRQQETSNKDGMDLALCVIDFHTNRLHFAGAKNPLLYIKNNTLHEIKGTPMPIGGKESYYKRRETQNIRFTQQTLEIEPDMVFYMFSDGFYDQFNEEGQKYLRKNFYQFLLAHHHLSFEEQKTKLTEEINDWIGNRHQIDDITVLGFRVRN